MTCPCCEAERNRAANAERRTEAVLVDLENAKTQNLGLLRQLNFVRSELERTCETDPVSADVRDVLDHWRVQMGKTSRTLTPADGKRAKAVRARLRQGFTVDRLKRAVDGCGRSAWHMGENPQQRRYDDIADICASESSVEKFEAVVESPGERRQRVGRELLMGAREKLAELRSIVELQQRCIAMQDGFINRLLDEVADARRRMLRVVA